MLTFGDKQLATRIPADLDARLIAATGCSAAEHANMIRQRPTPFGVARVAALLADPPVAVGELALQLEDLDAGAMVRLAHDVAALISPAGAPVAVAQADSSNG